MPKGISVHVGVNQPNPEFGVATLQGCLNDAEAMFQIARDNEFEATALLLNKTATLNNVEAAITDAAQRLKAGDIFLFTFAGHGSISPAPHGSEELDSQDESILLYDCILIDNYLRLNLWSLFKKDVRILGIADCCHSGTILKSVPPDLGAPSAPGPITIVSGDGAVTAGSATPIVSPDGGLEVPPIVAQPTPVIGKGDRAFSPTDRDRIVRDVSPEIHKDMSARLKQPERPLDAKLLTLGACKDLELARDGADHGVFTKALIDVWNNGAFPVETNPDNNNYGGFIKQIADKVLESSGQNPVLRPLEPDPNFVNQRPFTIG